jgi:SAM-dependent methyltransferase
VGSGWFVNSCSYFYGCSATGIDLNPVVLKQARSVARLIDGCETNQFIETNLFDFQPEYPFTIVNSLGVLHHTPDCHAAIRHVLKWVAPGGYLHLGLYHRYGRKPFLDHFKSLQARGATDAELYEEFKILNPNITDETHMLSWFRDQVLHPHETQHTYEEITALLASEGFVIEATSINNFKKPLPLAEIIEMEQGLAEVSKKALYQKRRYFPGFFVLWARRS